MDIPLTTLDAVKAQMKATTTDAPDDSLIMELIMAATDFIHAFCHRQFLPRVATRVFDVPASGLVLDLHDDLLTLDTLTNGDGTVITSGYRLQSPNLYPKWRIELLATAGTVWTYTSAPQEAISVAGIWGYHEAWPHAWIDTLETVPVGGLTSGASSFTALDADGKDARYQTRFEVGKLLKIESEYLRIVAVNTTTNVVTVLRGQAGTTAAAHAQSTAIYAYAPMRVIEKTARDLAIWMHRNRAVAGDELTLAAGGVKVTRNKALKDIIGTLAGFQEVRVT